jgi:hypothetical protein
MADSTDVADLPPEILRLTRRERKYAVPVYQRTILKLEANYPEWHDNQRRALNPAYAIAGGYWLQFATLFGLPGAIWLSFSKSLGPILLLTVAGCFCLLGLWRLIQGFRFFPHMTTTWTQRRRANADRADQLSPEQRAQFEEGCKVMLPIERPALEPILLWKLRARIDRHSPPTEGIQAVALTLASSFWDICAVLLLLIAIVLAQTDTAVRAIDFSVLAASGGLFVLGLMRWIAARRAKRRFQHGG